MRKNGLLLGTLALILVCTLVVISQSAPPGAAFPMSEGPRSYPGTAPSNMLAQATVGRPEVEPVGRDMPLASRGGRPRSSPVASSSAPTSVAPAVTVTTTLAPATSTATLTKEPSPTASATRTATSTPTATTAPTDTPAPTPSPTQVRQAARPPTPKPEVAATALPTSAPPPPPTDIPAPPATDTPAPPPPSASGAEQTVSLRLINEARAANGLPGLVLDAPLSVAAQRHAEEMAHQGYLSHTNRAGQQPWDRMAAAGAAFGAASENIGRISCGDAEACIRALHAMMMAETPPNDSHRRNLLEPRFRRLGVGVARGGGMLYWVCDFAD